MPIPSLDLPLITTLAPSLTNNLAVSAPIPLVPPVISAVYLPIYSFIFPDIRMSYELTVQNVHPQQDYLPSYS